MPREIKSPPAVILSSKSFDGLHEIQFNEGSHRYKLDGKQTVGVTTFTKSGYPTSVGLISWMKGQTAEALFKALTVPNENGGFMPRQGFWPITSDNKKELFKSAKAADKDVAREAADIGTICHSFAELHSLGKMKEADSLLTQVKDVQVWPLIKNCVEKYKEWAGSKQGELVHAEALVGSPTHLFCGKFDRLDNVTGKLRLRDYKTSKDIFLDQFIQLAAYTIAIKEWLNLEVYELEVLRFGKDDGTFDTLTSTQLATECDMSHDELLESLRNQALRCKQTYEFRKLENISRWAWKGSTK